MRAEVTIGIDVGTSGCKAVVLTRRGRVLHTVRATYPTRRTPGGEVTQDGRDWLRAVRAGLRECAVATTGRPVGAIGLTAPAHAAVLSGFDDEPVTRTLLAFDGRPAAVAGALRERYGPSLFEKTFVELTAGWTLPQLAWVSSQQPDVLERTRWLLTQKDWIRYRLTGEALTDASDAAGTAMMDQRSRQWLWPLCRDVGLRAEQLPPIVSSTASGGGLTRSWARAVGLPQGTPVVVGATDTAAELVSVGATESGSSLVKIASTGTVVGVSNEPVVDRRLLTYPHALPDRWYTLAATNTAAVSYQWLRETVFAAPAAEPAVTYADMDRRAARVPAGSQGVLFLPFLEGERTPWWDPRLRGAFIGLSSGHGRDHLARAVLEGVALALRSCRDVMTAAGFAVDRPFLGGGGVSSRLWRSILVSALDVEGVLTEPQGPAVGAAILAAACGTRTGEELRTRMRAPRLVPVSPNPAWAATYDAFDALHRQAAGLLVDISHRLLDEAGGRAGASRPPQAGRLR
jgi:xylulokinase